MMSFLKSSVYAAWTLVALISLTACGQSSSQAEIDKAREAFKQYQAEAWAHFEKRCKEAAGERIDKVIEGEASILIMNPRQAATTDDYADQFWMGDPWGRSGWFPEGEEINYYDILISGLKLQQVEIASSNPCNAKQCVDRKRFDEGLWKRREAQLESFAATRDHSPSPAERQTPIEYYVVERGQPLTSRYGFRWEDTSTKDDRKYWVAGGKMQVVELASGKVIAEKTGFLIEHQFGNRNQRMPWSATNFNPRTTCPNPGIDPVIYKTSKEGFFLRRVFKNPERK